MSSDRSAMDIVRQSRTLAYTSGVISLVAGLVLLFWPDRTVVVVARLTGLLLVVVGLADLVDALANHRERPYWGLLALRGLVNVVTGVALVVWPGVTVGVLVWIVGLDLVLTGVLGLVIRTQAPPELRSVLLSRSLLTIAFGIVVMAWPHATLLVVTVAVGLLLVLVGLVFLWSGRQLSKASVVVIDV